ncbi:MAG: NADH-quinone oxidoreductase subunit C [Desulfuromonadales bacterium]|nr:NADH-quinone oxidoreductase subunit C [Desulfuromonadales bacterium]NIR34117.1 NADH-quinone oxidoreductase subunit C [Desulfuromonadales bacterium]NIS41573.1 NADH-quinone oxidoreductase subunit C [Desulfuromonadales bacterium]
MIYEKIASDLKGLYERSSVNHGMLVMEARADSLLALIRRLKDDFAFDLFLDVTAVDYPQRQLRFEVVYHLYSSSHRKRIRLKVPVGQGQARMPTLTHLYGSARYMEREVHEMYGIRFAGNNDLRPILLYEGFDGHPLRKDYPMDREQPLVKYRK